MPTLSIKASTVAEKAALKALKVMVAHAVSTADDSDVVTVVGDIAAGDHKISNVAEAVVGADDVLTVTLDPA